MWRLEIMKDSADSELTLNFHIRQKFAYLWIIYSCHFSKKAIKFLSRRLSGRNPSGKEAFEKN